MSKKKINSVWKSVDEYADFAMKRHVFGADAVKLKIKEERQVIPVPKIKKKK